MKIKNKYDGSVIESSSLEDKVHFYRLATLGNCNIMFKHDGWEEVKEEPNDGWHDLRKNPNDLPPYYHRVIVTNGSGTDTYATFRVKDNPDRDINDFLRMFFTAGPYNNVIAWMELPTFNED